MTKSFSSRVAVGMAAFLLLAFASCNPGGPPGGSRVEFLLDWKGDPTYAGVYVAKELGYFADEKLDVRITEGSGGSVAAQIVGVGQAHWIGTASGSATAIARSKGVGIKSVAVLYPDISTVLYSMAAKPIDTPGDLPGKRIGLVSGSVTWDEFNALLAANKIDPASVEIVGVNNDPSPLLSGAVDGLVDYGELLPSALRARGEKIVSFSLSQHGVRMYGLNLIVNETALADPQKREIARKVRRAILRGYEFLRDQPAQAANVYLRSFPEKDPKYVRMSMPIVAAELGSGTLGDQATDGWDRTTATLVDLGLIGHSIPSASIIANLEN